ncbi:hypothetical protein [Lysobacter capsici]|uniref:hypothetical protein n=1 Tax=Lysobacter capsici TaxID=435897 RepID=UPI001C003B92|nr:hypothetical protein [Lysobacter capsici]QWF16494.1 hypothetical protein KME82_22535 [Lysobacter capsici]
MKYPAPFAAVALASALVLTCTSAFAQAPSNNPMDGVGVAHNSYAGCVVAQDPRSQRNPVEVMINECGYQTQRPRDEAIAYYTAFVEQAHTDRALSLTANLAPYRKHFSAAQYAYFENAERILATSRDAAEASRKLVDLENAAVNHLARGDTDRAVLGGLSTLRHSLELWGNSSVVTAGPIEVAAADAAGFVVGFMMATENKLEAAVANAVAQSVAAALR